MPQELISCWRWVSMQQLVVNHSCIHANCILVSRIDFRCVTD
jgi:hypothetical protein